MEKDMPHKHTQRKDGVTKLISDKQISKQRGTLHITYLTYYILIKGPVHRTYIKLATELHSTGNKNRQN